MAAFMGHPVRDVDVELTSVASLFAEAGTSRAPESRTRSTVAQALGNSMHINAIGAIIGLVSLLPLGEVRVAVLQPRQSEEFGVFFQSALKRRRA
jgi:hypothetical protein